MDDNLIIRNAPFWVDVFCKRYVRVIEGFRAAAVEKVDPAFADIEADAENSAEAEYERLMGLPSNGEIDPGDIAEQANEHGIEYLEVMSAMQQGVRNGLVVGLHHLLEQLQLAFFRQLALRTSEKPKDLQKLLLTCGIDTQGFSSSGRLNELRLAANTVKHGRGPAARQLAALRPDLFKHPASLSESRGGALSTSSNLEPLAGEGLYVTVESLSEWVDAVIAYWEELSEVLIERWRRYRNGEPPVDLPF